MDLGQKLKTARLEAGLSQRQLCGDIITRNMLSQIENGNAKPSYATLQALCAKLGKPVSYFWEDAPSQNLALLHKAQSAPAEEALALLDGYLSPDPLLDVWYHRLLARCCMDCAEQALSEKRGVYAQALLSRAEDALKKSGEPVSRRLLLLRYGVGNSDTLSLAAQLPDNTDEQLLRARAALEKNEPGLCLAFVDTADRQTAAGQLLRCDAHMMLGQYDRAVSCLLPLEAELTTAVYPRLEQCFKALGDFEKAYNYACKQR